MPYEPTSPPDAPPPLSLNEVDSQQVARPEYYPDTYRPEPADRPSFLKRAGGVVAAAIALIVKFGVKLKALLLLLPKLKILTTSASMLVSVAAYSLIWGWQFALGFVLLLLVHEM